MRRKVLFSCTIFMVLSQLTACALIPEKKTLQTVDVSTDTFVIDKELVQEQIALQSGTGTGTEETDETYTDITMEVIDGLVNIILPTSILNGHEATDLFPIFISTDIMEVDQQDEGYVAFRMGSEVYYGLIESLQEDIAVEQEDLVDDFGYEQVGWMDEEYKVLVAEMKKKKFDEEALDALELIEDASITLQVLKGDSAYAIYISEQVLTPDGDMLAENIYTFEEWMEK